MSSGKGDMVPVMEGQGNEITFMFQFGLIRDCVTVQQQSLNLKTIKELACDFVNSKVCFFAPCCQIGTSLLLKVLLEMFLKIPRVLRHLWVLF